MIWNFSFGEKEYSLLITSERSVYLYSSFLVVGNPKDRNCSNASALSPDNEDFNDSICLNNIKFVFDLKLKK